MTIYNTISMELRLDSGVLTNPTDLQCLISLSANARFTPRPNEILDYPNFLASQFLHVLWHLAG
jgi:hypothetical protein